ncbi:MAG: hypothetical protein SVY10_19225 [Thermodesulfobacteriota bacterium]|nr:hypothetical protein [Thermodesulfobacteriota bacterium]
MKSTLTILFALLILVFCPIFFPMNSVLGSCNTVKLIDASGSMTGFFKTGLIYNICDKIHNAVQDQQTRISSYYFKYYYSGSRIRGGLFEYREYDHPSQADGEVTLIDRAFKDVISKNQSTSIVWLITDNIQDPEGRTDEQGDINQFYEKLRNDINVNRVHIFPLSLDFNGTLYERDGQTPLGQYTGKRGLVVYAILLDVAWAETFESQITNFSRLIQFPSRKGILCKPLEEGDVTVIAEEISHMDGKGNFTKQSPLIYQKGGELTSEKIFSVHESIEGAFLIRILSRMENIYISKPEVQLTLIEDFKQQDFKSGSPKLVSDPVQLEYDLVPDRFSQDIRIFIALERGVAFAAGSPGAYWHALFQSRAADYRGKIRVSLKVKKSHFGLVEDIREKYSTNDPRYFQIIDKELQSRIFGLDKIFLGAAKEAIWLKIQDYTINFRIQYPSWPIFVFLISICTVLALFFVGASFLLKSPDFRLVGEDETHFHFWVKKPEKEMDEYEDNIYREEYDEGRSVPNEYYEGEPVNLRPLLGQYPVYIENRKAAKIKRLPLFGVFVKAERGFSIEGNNKKSLKMTHYGTDFIIEKRTEGTPTEMRSNENTFFSSDYPEY